MPTISSRRPRGALVLSLGLLLGLGLPLQDAKAVPVQADWKKIKAPPLPTWNPQQPKQVQLDNGLLILLQPDPELPLIDFSVHLRGGAQDEPAGKLGLASLYSATLRAGGTRGKTGDQIDEFLAARAADIEVGTTSDGVTLGANCHKADFDAVLGLIREILAEPEFRQDKLDLAKRQRMTAISRRNDDPGSIAGREAMKLALGPTHPLARHPEYATLAAVSREDLLAWHKQHLHPNQMMLGISGDFDAAQMETRLRAAFGALPKGPAYQAAQLAFHPTKPGVFFVSKDDVNQTNIQLVQLGIQRNSPDHHAVEVLNEILGGGFSARLFTNIRSRQSLAYSVRGGVGMNWEYPGIYRLSMSTKSESTVQAIQALYAEVNNLLTSLPPTDTELALAKEAILNSFIFRFENKSDTMDSQLQLLRHGYPVDYWEKFPAEIAKVTLADVKRVAQKYLNPTGFALLVVGNAQAFDKPLTTVGPVTNIDITIPPPPPSTAAQKK